MRQQKGGGRARLRQDGHGRVRMRVRDRFHLLHELHPRLVRGVGVPSAEVHRRRSFRDDGHASKYPYCSLRIEVALVVTGLLIIGRT